MTDQPYVALQTVMMPADLNPQGTIFGGVILSHIDMAGHTGARHHVIAAGGAVPVLVTVALNRVEFKHPVLVGDIIRCLVSVVKFGRTSSTSPASAATSTRSTSTTNLPRPRRSAGRSLTAS